MNNKFKRPKLDVDVNYLHCPFCKSYWLHHEDIIVFSRYEDDKETIVTTVSDKKTKEYILPSHETGNPSLRRHGLTLTFSCEDCKIRGMKFHIYQHKGSTIMEWGEFSNPNNPFDKSNEPKYIYDTQPS